MPRSLQKLIFSLTVASVTLFSAFKPVKTVKQVTQNLWSATPCITTTEQVPLTHWTEKKYTNSNAKYKNDCLEKIALIANKDLNRPSSNVIRGPGGWENDSHALFFEKQIKHLTGENSTYKKIETVFLHRFYQNNPENDEWGGSPDQKVFVEHGGICWSHDIVKLNTTESLYQKDLQKNQNVTPIHVKRYADMEVIHRGIAIAANPDYQEQHIFSGSIAKDLLNNELEIYYTRVHSEHSHFINNSLQAQAVCLDERGEDWHVNSLPILKTPSLKGVFKMHGKPVTFYECRDPYVFSFNDEKLMLLGGYIGPENQTQNDQYELKGRHRQNNYGAIAIARKIDDKWKAGEVIYVSKKEGSNIECPSFSMLNNHGLLLFSLQEQAEHMEDRISKKVQGVKYVLGNLQYFENELRFIPDKDNEEPSDFCNGNSAYATTLAYDQFGDRMLSMSWVRGVKDALKYEDHQIKTLGWQGYSLLNEVHLTKEGHLVHKPLWETSSKKNIYTRDSELNEPLIIKESNNTRNIVVVFNNPDEEKWDENQENKIEIIYRKPHENIPEGKLSATIKRGKIFITNPTSGKHSFRSFSSRYYGEETKKKVRILIDKCSVQIYACGDRYHFITTISPDLNNIPKKYHGFDVILSSNKKIHVQYNSEDIKQLCP